MAELSAILLDTLVHRLLLIDFDNVSSLEHASHCNLYRRFGVYVLIRNLNAVQCYARYAIL